jgi:son of sevenless-like protein
MGAGAAASWKGLGWVALDEHEEAPGRILGSEVTTELDAFAGQIRDKIFAFHSALNMISDALLLGTSQDLIGGISSLLIFVANIHIARHVDIDGIGRELSNASDGDLYLQTVSNARLLVRTLEAAMQSLYDDGSSLLLTIQAVRHSYSREEHDTYRDYMDAISTGMAANLDVVCQTLDSLLSIGHDQADMSQGDYNGSIEWRMSRISVTPTQSLHRPTSGLSVIDIAMALNAPGRKHSVISSSDQSMTYTASSSTLVAPRSDTPASLLSDRDTDSVLDKDGQSQTFSVATLPTKMLLQYSLRLGLGVK